MKDIDNAIEVSKVSKSFRVYFDKGRGLKEFAIFSKRRKYELRQVLNDISFTVKKGETVALIGHNGCGKSTTLKLLTRIMYPDSGKIKMAGRVSALIELGAGFHPDMTGRENIYINASIFGLTRSEINRKINDIINFSELGDYIDNPVRTYSSGMYMRLAFSVAINVSADILLIDEILAVGDVNFQKKCYEKMQELKKQGVTIVIVTHDMNTVKSFCDRAIWINDGKIMGDGISSEVVEEYMRYMNEQQNGKGTEQTASEQKNSANGDHYGNQKAVFTSAQLLSADGKVTDVIRSEQDWKLRVNYKINSSVDALIFCLELRTAEGVDIFGTASTSNGNLIQVTNKKEGQIVLDFSPLHLLTGSYVLQLAIQEPDGTVCDFYKHYMTLNVKGLSKWSNDTGIIHYDVKWRYN
jgi:ABC-type polysaccharide/polyol phosphate transport system ATPase subunit